MLYISINDNMLLNELQTKETYSTMLPMRKLEK